MIDKSTLKKYIKRFWVFLFSAFVLFNLIILLVYLGVFGKLPSTDKLENPETPLATEIYSEDGVCIGKFFNENRSNVTFDEISPFIINALISTEDIRYYKHAGIDWKGTFAIPYYLIRGKKKGASTITQQLAKNLFPRQRFDNIFVIVVRKLKEWIIAIQLERFYTKEEIITMYLNTVDFGSNAYGIKSAAKTFFNKPPSTINVEEAATLIGVLKATQHFSPVYNYDNSVKRRNTVLKQMSKYDFITKQQYDSLSKAPISLDYMVESQNQGLARYFREFLRIDLADWCAENGYDLYTSGLKIYTTINSHMQKYAEEAARQHLKSLQKTFFEHWKGKKNAPFDYRMTKKEVESLMEVAIKRTDRYKKLKTAGYTWENILKNFKKPVKMKVFAYDKDEIRTMSPYDSIKYYKYFLNPGFMAMEPSTGHIKAWVGGIDFKYFKYDHVNKSAKRQVGSTFKPFVYTTAIKEGYSPCLKVPNVPVVFPDFDNWQPKNSDNKYGGMITLQGGLAESNNCVTSWIIKQIGPAAVVELAKSMGIESKVDPYPSIALGTPDISVFEMVGAFNTFANKGTWVEPTYITRIEDKSGKIIKQFIPKEREVLAETYAYVMLTMLMNVVNYGTGARLRSSKYNFSNQIAAKTGTTQNNSDGWFIGMVPELTAGGWVGCEDRSVHFRTTDLGQGANMVLPIWGIFMNKVYADTSLGITKKDFDIPDKELPVEINCKSYEKENETESMPEF